MTSAEENDELEILEVAVEQQEVTTVAEEVEAEAQEVEEVEVAEAQAVEAVEMAEAQEPAKEAKEVKEEKKAKKPKKTKRTKAAKKGKLMSTAVRKSLTTWAEQNDLPEKKATRLQALLLVDEGMTQSAAAAATNLSVSQVTYAVGQFREKGESMFISPAEKASAAEPEERNTAVETDVEAVPVEEVAETTPEAADEETMVRISPQQFRAMMAELNKFADRIQQQVKFTPPPFSADEMLALMQKLTPERLTIINDMQNMLDNRPDAKELFDPDTWRGMWFILTYTAQNESKSLFGKAKATVTRIPGVSFGMRTGMAIFNKLPGSALVLDVLGMLEGASPKDLLDPETWRGMIYLINYSLQYELEQMKERLWGANTAVDDDELEELATNEG